MILRDNGTRIECVVAAENFKFLAVDTLHGLCSGFYLDVEEARKLHAFLAQELTFYRKPVSMPTSESFSDKSIAFREVNVLAPQTKRLSEITPKPRMVGRVGKRIPLPRRAVAEIPDGIKKSNRFARMEFD